MPSKTEQVRSKDKSLPVLLTVRDLAGMTGECQNTWRYRIYRREIPSIKFARGVRVDRDDFLRWLRSRKRGAMA